MARRSWVQRDGKLIPKNEAPPRPRERPGPDIMPDLPEYTSPIDGRLISGRRQRREDLARNDCRPYEKGEREEFARQKESEQRALGERVERYIRERFS